MQIKTPQGGKTKVLVVGRTPLGARAFLVLQGQGYDVANCVTWDEARAAWADVVVEAIGGVTPAFEVVMKALGMGKRCVTANTLLMAVHGRVLMNASLGGQAPFGFGAAMGVAAPLVAWLRQVPPSKVWIGLAGAANRVLMRVEERGESFARAQQVVSQSEGAYGDVQDIQGKQSLAMAVTLQGAMGNGWLPVAMLPRGGFETVMAEDSAWLRKFGLRLRYAAELDGGCATAGVVAIGPNHALMEAPQRDVVVVEHSHGETVLTRAAVDEEATAQLMAADVRKVMQERRVWVAPVVEAAGVQAERLSYVRVPYAWRAFMLQHGLKVQQEQSVQFNGVVQWLAVGRHVGPLTPEEGLVVPVAGAWEAVGLRLVG